MADCSYSRCVQERRNIRRELQKWTKNMVYIVGLERIAEELMGRRKWKLYQECMSRTHQQQQQQQQLDNNNSVLDSKAVLAGAVVKQEPRTTFSPPNPANDLDEQQERLKDWSPQNKCYFCVDGKLDSDHTTHGALSPRPSDSESSDSPSDSEAPPTLTPPAAAAAALRGSTGIGRGLPAGAGPHHPASVQYQHAVAAALQRDNVASSMASLAAVAALTSAAPPHPANAPNNAPQMPYYPQLFATAPSWYLNTIARNLQHHQQQQAQQASASPAERMDVDKPLIIGGSGEQPLDLSARPSALVAPHNNNNHAANATLDNKLPANMRLPVFDPKIINDFRPKPRMTAMGGRRTYTEEELQAALRDIQSGKLGTRRAAVIYGIPRSTLRNKVYKLAMERERETHLVSTGPLGLEDDAMDDDKELSGAEEEKEVEKALQAPLLSVADIVRFSNIAESPEALRGLLIQHQLKTKDGAAATDLWAGLEHSALGPYIQLMMAQQLAAGTKEADLLPMLPELMRKIIAEEQHLNNGESTDGKPAATPSPSQPSPANSVKAERQKTDSMSDMDTDESPSNVILKIPSFKPTTSKNGGDMYVGVVPPVVSPPISASESGSPPIVAPGPGGSMLTLREAIAKSISQKFQQSPDPLKLPPGVEIDYSRAGFTPPLAGITPVLKNHHHPASQQGGPPSEPPTPPATNVMPTTPTGPSLIHQRTFQPNNIAINNNIKGPGSGSATSNSSGSSGTTGGKGTRPKRGKYRNYDRDSLVEAVRAVQRGEMSVHRAGSYYGVPHSTLEYKVKERHLMRPRKRDPKPNPVDEKIASMKSQDQMRNIPDKMKPVIKPPQKFPPTSPNGMKMPPMFDPAIAPLGGYTPPPFPFWPHPSFPHLPIDYPRNPSTSQFTHNPEFFASQMMQRLQEQSVRCHPDAAAAATSSSTGSNSNGGGAAATSSGSSAPTTPTALVKSAREMAESLYDGTGANGSFLDGIIRSSLESGVPITGDKAGNKEGNKNVAPENMSNKALLDQLCRNSRITPLPKASSVEPNSSGDESYRKSVSPLNFAKKEGFSGNGTSIGKHKNDEIQTIELSNDSNESSSTKEDDAKTNTSTNQSPPPQPQSQRIYVKPQFQELTKPENLKPEVLVRFRTTTPDEMDDSDRETEPSPAMLVERNGIGEAMPGSASDTPDVAQD